MKRLERLGFTLLEVMIAVVILAIGLSSLFTSEAGAIRIAQRARTTTVATLLARCKMAEIEEQVSKGTGWPTSNLEERDECCDGGEKEGFRCEWKVERIKLPDQDEAGDGGVGKDGKDSKESKDSKGGSEGAAGGEKSAGKPNILDQFNELGKDNDERMGAITDLLSGGGSKGGGELSGGSDPKKKRDAGADEDDESMGEELDPIGSMVMNMAFPVMKPVIEDGVRRATVKVLWKEGDKEQEFEINQFLVSEQQAIAAEGEDADGGVTPTGTPGLTPPGTAGTQGAQPNAPPSTTGGN
ncbi:MAG: type II secretion system protein [Polyangiales bacterium]